MKKIFLILLMTISLLYSNSFKNNNITDMESLFFNYFLNDVELNEKIKEKYTKEKIYNYINKNISKYNTDLKSEMKINELINKILKYSKLYFKEDFHVYAILLISQMEIESFYKNNKIGDNGNSFGFLQIHVDTASFLLNKYFNIDYKKYKIEELQKILQDVDMNIQFSLLTFKEKKETIKRLKSKKIINKNYEKFIENEFKKIVLENEIEKYYKNYYTLVSLYNGGIKNSNYVNKVFRVFNEIYFN